MDSHRILVVEPHSLNRVVMAQQLATLGHACTCVGDADAALARLAAEPFDLVLTACRMPGVDGFFVLNDGETVALTTRQLPVLPQRENWQLLGIILRRACDPLDWAIPSTSLYSASRR